MPDLQLDYTPFRLLQGETYELRLRQFHNQAIRDRTLLVASNDRLDYILEREFGEGSRFECWLDATGSIKRIGSTFSVTQKVGSELFFGKRLPVDFANCKLTFDLDHVRQYVSPRSILMNHKRFVRSDDAEDFYLPVNRFKVDGNLIDVFGTPGFVDSIVVHEQPSRTQLFKFRGYQFQVTKTPILRDLKEIIKSSPNWEVEGKVAPSVSIPDINANEDDPFLVQEGNKVAIVHFAKGDRPLKAQLKDGISSLQRKSKISNDQVASPVLISAAIGICLFLSGAVLLISRRLRS